MGEAKTTTMSSSRSSAGRSPDPIVIALGALVAVQAAHSVEEYYERLWEVHPLARFVAGLFSSDLAVGFAIGNVLLVLFGVWCIFWPVRLGWKAAMGLAWLWVGIEAINGFNHIAWSMWVNAYRPGLLTAPFLLVGSAYLAYRLRVKLST